MKISDVIKIPSTYDIKRFLDEDKSEEVYSARELSEKFNISESTIKQSTILRPYRVSFDDRVYYASPANKALLAIKLERNK